MMSAKENLSKETNRSDAPPPGEAEQATEAGTPAGRPETEQATKKTTARAEVPFTPQQIEELKVRAAKADEHWDRLLRATADLENFKKRAARERQEATRFANVSLLEKLIPALDNFDMALAAANNDASGRPFDPNLHEALSQQETADVPEGQVLRQLRKGYKLRDRLIRPASVVVAKKPTA
ncbi:MAG: hypothetical protein DME21_04625 [Verrucomicrobia bacterium]|nr:MAG: hypothetical protein DME21_04625 [Verrucomicrobiota bacterium]